MIMMSGEDGSASYNNSQINMTQMTAKQYYQMMGSATSKQGPVAAISPSYKNNITNDAINSSIGPNPFAT